MAGRARQLFDDENLASYARLVPVMALAERAGSSELLATPRASTGCEPCSGPPPMPAALVVVSSHLLAEVATVADDVVIVAPVGWSPSPP